MPTVSGARRGGATTGAVCVSGSALRRHDRTVTRAPPSGHGRRRQQALLDEPLVEAVDPPVHRQAPPAPAEAVPPGGVGMQPARGGRPPPAPVKPGPTVR